VKATKSKTNRKNGSEESRERGKKSAGVGELTIHTLRLAFNGPKTTEA